MSVSTIVRDFVASASSAGKPRGSVIKTFEANPIDRVFRSVVSRFVLFFAGSGIRPDEPNEARPSHGHSNYDTVLY